MRYWRAVSGAAAGLALTVLLAMAAPAGETVSHPAGWQAVVTGQIEAFHRGDAAAALGFAGEAFRKNYPDPGAFVAWVRQTGYGPVLDSRSHSFGPYKLAGQASVLQIVRFVGPKQELYEAVYQLGAEADGWRIEGVSLKRQRGLGV